MGERYRVKVSHDGATVWLWRRGGVTYEQLVAPRRTT